MKFTKGLQTDTNEQDQPSDSYIWALNWVANEKMGSLVSERGFTYKFTLPDGKLPIGIMPAADKVVIFSTNGTDSEIGIYDEILETYTPRLNDAKAAELGGTSGSGLNFNLAHQIKAVYRYNSRNDLEVAFTDWFNTPKIVTLTTDEANMVDYYSPYDINKLNIFQTAKAGLFQTNITTSGNLPADTYFVFYRYKNVDLTTTNAFINPRPHYIIVDNIFDDYTDITGNDVGITTNKSINVFLTDKDTSFPFVEIGLYRVSTAEAKIIITIPSSQNSVSLNTFDGENIQNIEVIAPKTNYKTAKTITSLNDQLYIGNLSNPVNVVPQKYINNIKLDWVCRFIDPAADKSSKDYNVDLKTFCAGEVYSFVIRFLKKDGTYTQWQHIPGRKSNPAYTLRSRILTPTNDPLIGNYRTISYIDSVIDERALINTVAIPHLRNYTSSSNQNRYFHVVDTITSTRTDILLPIGAGTYPSEQLVGDFGFWENEFEQYSQYFSGEDAEIWDLAGKIGDLASGSNQTVRHHKFPSLYYLEQFSNGIYNFTKLFPQLSVRLLGTLDTYIPTKFTEDILSYEIGFSRRDFNNCTVYGQDLSLFGVYTGRDIQNVGDGTVAPLDPFPIYNESYSTQDAVYFTGSNSVLSAVSFRSHVTNFLAPNGVISGTIPLNSNPIRNFSHTPFTTAMFNSGAGAESKLPNRQRVHTPDIVDPTDPSKNPNIIPTHVRHEALMIFGDPDTVTINSGRKTTFATEGTTTNMTANTAYALIDYSYSTVNNNFNTGIVTPIAFSLKNMPMAWVHRNIRASGYVPHGTRSIVIGDNPVINAQFNISDGGGDLYGGSDHYHIQLFDDFYPRPDTELYANTTANIFALYSSFLTNQGYSGAGLAIPLSPNPNDPTFYFRHPIPSLNFSYGRFDSATGIRQHHTAFISSIIRLTKTIYANFNAIEPIIALKHQLGEGYTGDCFISEVNYTTDGWGIPLKIDTAQGPYVAQNFTTFRFYAHTRKNLDYRYERPDDLANINKYYPASRWNVNTVDSSGYQADEDQIFYKKTFTTGGDRDHAYQTLLYNTVYGQQADFKRISTIFSTNSLTSFIDDFPFRVHSSEKQAKESLLNNWRVFLPLNYYENDKTKGEITNLQGYDDQLLIHTVQSLFFTRDRGSLEASDLGITIGTGGIFDFPPKEVLFNNLGYTGTQHQFGCAMTKLGYVFPDAQQGKYFIYNKDSGLVELSNTGMYNYFKYFGKTIHNDYSPLPFTIEPPNSSGLSAWNACFDEFNGRLLIGYKQRIPGDPKSFTLSYTDFFKSFTSFHSYYPNLLTNTRKNVYSFDDSNNFYKHNTPNRRYYIGVPTRNEIDVVFCNTRIKTEKGTVEAGNDYTKLWQSFNWMSEMHNYTDTTISNLETFLNASVRTKKQCSELKLLVPFTNTRIYENSWYFNEFRDRLNRSGVRNQNFTQFVKDLNNEREITYPTNLDFNSRFVDTYVILRLVYDTVNSLKEIHLLDIDYTNQIVKK